MVDNLQAKDPVGFAAPRRAGDVAVWVEVLAATIRMIPEEHRHEVLQRVFARLTWVPPRDRDGMN